MAAAGGDADARRSTRLRSGTSCSSTGRVRQVVDIAYKPDGSATALVAAAREAGCERVVDGLDVLVAQGAASFERWTGGRGAACEVMQRAQCA